ncbi:hypothetical protein [Falsochrobactrum ovis]|uniref:hypothetical protein n=1 Tax=Falsochrobactrum ovis TaxID=1293442 RepID=UPI001FE138AD|nr:hypothetical protein [Falsochrobactrum ovis]
MARSKATITLWVYGAKNHFLSAAGLDFEGQPAQIKRVAGFDPKLQISTGVSTSYAQRQS